MKTNLCKTYDYDGIFTKNVKDIPISERKSVRILGVLKPVDPGMVLIDDGEKEIEVASFALEICPKIDYGQLLTDEQKDLRKKIGILIGCGITGNRTLVPLNECPLES